jgi:hypothetical protein
MLNPKYYLRKESFEFQLDCEWFGQRLFRLTAIVDYNPRWGRPQAELLSVEIYHSVGAGYLDMSSWYKNEDGTLWQKRFKDQFEFKIEEYLEEKQPPQKDYTAEMDLNDESPQTAS